MLTRDNMKFFIDPLSDPFLEADRVYVTEERTPRGTYLNKVVEVDGLYRHNGRMWRVTKEDRDYVSGPAVNVENLPYNQLVIGLREGDDSMFMVGRFLGMRNNRALLGNGKRSDQRSMPTVGTTAATHYLHADTWFPAAEWALQMMPNPTDSEALIRSRLALVEQRWTQRKAKVTLMIESMQRNYSQLDELIEEGSMPLPRFGAQFSGSILIHAGRAPGREQRTVSTQEQIDALQSRLGTTPEPSAMMMAMRVETPVPLEVTGRNGLDSVQPGVVRDALQVKLGNYDLRVTDYTLSPVLRGTAATADA